MLGTPGQRLQVIFDTGSADFWVNGQLFDGTQSETYIPDTLTFSVHYSDGDGVSGFRAFDSLTAGSAGSVTAPSVAFGEAEAMGNFYVCGAEDGVFGLAFRAISRLNAPTAFEMLAPHLDEEMFAFSVPTDTLAGELVLGGVDESRFVGDLQWIDVSTPHKYWQAALTSASIGAQPLGGSAAVFDTGTTLLVTTEANAWALAGALDAWCYAWVNATSSYDVFRCAEADEAATFPDLVVAPCGAGDDLVFRFGAVEARVPRDQYLYGQDCDEALEFRDCRGVCWPNEYLSWIDDVYCDDGSAGIFLNCPRFGCDLCPDNDCIEDPADDACLLSVAADDSVGTWILGDVFFSATYVAFDHGNARLGLAPLASGSAPVPAPLSPEPSPRPSPEPVPAPTVGALSSDSSPGPTVAPTVAPVTGDMTFSGLSLAVARANEAVLVDTIAASAGVEDTSRVSIVIAAAARRRLSDGVVVTYTIATDTTADSDAVLGALLALTTEDAKAALTTAAAAHGVAATFATVEITQIHASLFDYRVPAPTAQRPAASRRRRRAGASPAAKTALAATVAVVVAVVVVAVAVCAWRRRRRRRQETYNSVELATKSLELSDLAVDESGAWIMDDVANPMR